MTALSPTATAEDGEPKSARNAQGFDAVPSAGGEARRAVTRVDVAIVGTGFSGLGMAIRLAASGRTDFLLLERGGEVGGTWRDNTYPGAACDVPSHLYSFSFALNPDWSRSFSDQGEIQDYLVTTAERAGVREKARFGTEVTSATWDEAGGRWHLVTTAGEISARILISGAGALSEPSIPDLPGLDDFEGNIFHSAAWDHDYDLANKRVAVVGTGASAIQFVPQIQPIVDHLSLFQRTPAWVMPRRDRDYKPIEHWAFRHVPGFQRLSRSLIYLGREAFVIGLAHRPQVMRRAEKLARLHLRNQVSDPELRRALTPDYTLGCKRVLISNDYYPALAQPNVDVVPKGVASMTRHGIVDADGTEHPVDAVIFGTGFHVTDLPIAERIRGATGATLRETWHRGMAAHRGTTVAGFPNLFLLLGPNTGLGHTSVVFMIEAQIAYVMEAIAAMDDRGADTLEVTEAAQDAWTDQVQTDMAGTVWNEGGCASWYLDEHGNNTVLWPRFTFQFWQRTRRFDPGSYRLAGEGRDLISAGRARLAR